jgi:hypothetical protein
VLIQGADHPIQGSDQCGRATQSLHPRGGSSDPGIGSVWQGRGARSVDPRAGSCDPGVGSAWQGHAKSRSKGRIVRSRNRIRSAGARGSSDPDMGPVGSRSGHQVVIELYCVRLWQATKWKSCLKTAREQASKPARKQGRKEGRKREGCFTECLVAQQPMTLSLN